MNTKKQVVVVSQAVAAEKALAVTKSAPMYKVFLLNDDYTPMDFVVEVLMHFFLISEPEAIMIMLQVHKQGKGYCGIYTRDIAETKVALVNSYSRISQQPLLCQMELS